MQPISKVTNFQTAFGITDAWSADYPQNFPIGITWHFKRISRVGTELEFSSNTRSNTPRIESVNRETKVREELAWVYVQFLFLASFSAPLVDGASGLRVRGRVCDSQNWFYFPIPEDRIYSSWHNHPLTHGRPQNTGHTNRSEMLLKLVWNSFCGQ